MRIKLLLIVLALIGAGYFGYSHFFAAKPTAAGGPPQGGIPVEAVQVETGAVQTTLSTVGTLRADESLMLRPEITGRVEAIHFTEGTPVKKGAVLIALDDRIYAAELKQAEAALNLASVSYKRAKTLKEKGAGTVSNFDTMNAALGVAQAQVDLSAAKLEKTKIIAPFDGVVGLRHVSPGDYVNPGQDLASFQNTGVMKADFSLPENAARFVKKDQTINISVDAIPDKTFSGTVFAIDPQIDAANRSITLRARIPNTDGQLQAGFFARVSLIVEEKAAAMLVPESAIIPRGNENYVFAIGADKKIISQKVTLGERKAGKVEILTGLVPESIVVTAGHLKVREGAEVSYQLPAAEKAEAN